MYDIRHLERKIINAIKDKKIPKATTLQERLDLALEQNILTKDEVEQVLAADEIRYRSIQVDHFSHDFSEIRTHAQPSKTDKAQKDVDSAA